MAAGYVSLLERCRAQRPKLEYTNRAALRALVTQGSERVTESVLWRWPDHRRRWRDYTERRYWRHIAWSMEHSEHFRARQLPPGYGYRMSERAVEYGWAIAQAPHGRVLDAGSALNHDVTLDAVLPHLESLTIVTLAPEPASSVDRGVNYVYGDLRSLSFPDASFDTVVCISTLEHVGLDNTRYGGATTPIDDPRRAAQHAMRELIRVARSGATLMITVPFGTSWTGDWVRQFDAVELDDLLALVQPVVHEETVFAHGHAGWQVTTRQAAATATYRSSVAEAVACLKLVLPQQYASKAREGECL
jgi:hypothetical protein